MKERPILFNDEMVRAILDGRKTQTRRIVPLDEHGRYVCHAVRSCLDPNTWERDVIEAECKYGRPGDRLWVREAHDLKATEDGWRVRYHADASERLTDCDVDCHTDERWDDWISRPSIHMFRWASRILLEITDVRVERLQDISETDAGAEGVQCGIDCSDHYIAFSKLWGKINGHGSWSSNPWVWAIEFKVIKK